MTSLQQFTRSSGERTSTTRLQGRRNKQRTIPLQRQPQQQQQQEFIELKQTSKNEPPINRPCVICVGTTGSGKSSTVNRVTLQRRAKSSAGFERQTEKCEKFAPSNPDDPVWIDTVGWEDNAYEDGESFREILTFLRDNKLNQIKAIIWNIIPNIRLDSILIRQAKFINLFKPGVIWRNVIIVCKQSMKPERDGMGAFKAAEALASTDCAPQVTGYRFLSDLSDDQQDQMENDPKLRKSFNVVTNDEVREILQKKLKNCGPAIEIVFHMQKCLDCGEVGDARLMPIFCHMESHSVHPQSAQIVHPAKIEYYHANDTQIVEHEGRLKRPYYGAFCFKTLVKKRYTCCNKTYGKVGCVVKWACCKQEVLSLEGEEQNSGCRRRFGCCKKDPDTTEEGCQARYLCCGRRTTEPGCTEQCRKCDRPWGSPAGQCYKKSHNVIDLPPATKKSTEENEGDDYRVDFNLVNNNSDEYKSPKMFLGLPPIILSKPF